MDKKMELSETELLYLSKLEAMIESSTLDVSTLSYKLPTDINIIFDIDDYMLSIKYANKLTREQIKTIKQQAKQQAKQHIKAIKRN